MRMEAPARMLDDEVLIGLEESSGALKSDNFISLNSSVELNIIKVYR